MEFTIMAIKAVIFDIGGVLLHNTGHEKERTWETQAGLPEGAIFKYINRSGLGNAATRGQLSRQELWSKVSEHFKIDLAQIRTFEANLVDAEVLNTELAEFLQSLRPKYKTALLSNAWPGTREAFNQKYGLDKLVDLQIFSAEEGTLKPETKFYQLALIRLQVRGYETVFLDDNAVNVDAADLFGMRSIHYRNNEQAIKEIKRVIA
jgi:epoxide hydrolase-like predicted phosphatase